MKVVKKVIRVEVTESTQWLSLKKKVLLFSVESAFGPLVLKTSVGSWFSVSLSKIYRVILPIFIVRFLHYFQ